MVKAGDKVSNKKLSGEFWANSNTFTGFFAIKASGGYQLIRFTEWTGDDGTRYFTDTVADASAVLPARNFRRFVTHQTGATVYYGFLPAA
jgi:hypothetical protein